jgi:hypothetical protein
MTGYVSKTMGRIGSKQYPRCCMDDHWEERIGRFRDCSCFFRVAAVLFTELNST